jgi:ribonucleoside-diphosphate reductase beta chain
MSIFDEQISRKPDHYPWTETFMRAMWEGHWTDKEFNFASDKQDFMVKMDDQQREIVVRALSAIAQIEVAVKTFWAKLGDNLPHPSIKDMGYVMANIEVIHNNAYERLLKELDIENVIEENLNLEWMEGRVNYLRKYTHRFYSDSKQQFLYALILFTLFVENVSLFSQFYVIMWFGRDALLKDTQNQVLYTMREEELHAKIGIELINTIRGEHPELFDESLEERVANEALEAFKAEKKIIKWMVNGIDEPTLNSDLLEAFIKNRINTSLVDIGYKKPFELTDEDKAHLKNTMWFEELVLGDGMTDFFHGRSVDYAISSMSFAPEDLF